MTAEWEGMSTAKQQLLGLKLCDGLGSLTTAARSALVQKTQQQTSSSPAKGDEMVKRWMKSMCLCPQPMR
jgi:hypothetical protein